MTTEMTAILTQSLYEQDYLLWLEITTKQLAERDLEHLDWQHLREEIQALGREQRNKVESYLKQLLLHLLLYEYWEAERHYCGRDWQVEIENFRQELALILQFKTLYNHLLQQWDKVYTQARKLAIIKTALPAHIFPVECPFTVEQVLQSKDLL